MLPDHFSPLSVDIKLFVLALDVLVVLAQTAPGKQNHGEQGKGSEDGILTTESLENWTCVEARRAHGDGGDLMKGL